MEFKPKKHNTPITALLKNYGNKKSGKVIDSRKEIQWRFAYLDWRDQKKILKAFLSSGINDREWAAKQLVLFWDNNFEPLIKEMWEESQDDFLARPIIRYFPLDYLKSNLEKLGNGRNYYFICLRLADEKDFEIIESKLRETDLLRVYCNSARILTKEKAKDVLYTIVNKLCTGKYPYPMDNLWSDEEERGYMLSMLEHKVMKEAIRCLKRLNLNDIIAEFVTWHIGVCEHLLSSDEFAKLYASKINQNDYNFRRIILTKKYYYDHLNSKYKQTDEKPVFGIEYFHIWQDNNFEKNLSKNLYIEVDEVELEHYHYIQEKALKKVYEECW